MSSNKSPAPTSGNTQRKAPTAKPLVLSYPLLNRQVRQVSGEHRCFVPGYN